MDLPRTRHGGEKHSLYVRLLKDRETRLTSKLPELKKRAKELHDTSYDLGFAWANKDGAGKEYIYCSELIWKAFKDAVRVELKKPHPLSDYINSPPPGRTSQDIEKDFEIYLNKPKSKERRDGQPYKRDELAISPREVFESSELEPVVDAAK
jgi:Permuted papain-like amidase enzyme, YaeF/YiiX, C92 family